MPSVTIEGPKIDNLEIKKVLMKEITDALEKAYSLPRQTDVFSMIVSPKNTPAPK
ncbi:hypothetical protein ACFL0P_07560 [Candidatus Omnitrophota bacterium]